MFIIEAIKRLKNSKRVFFTTPTHLGSNIIPSNLKSLIGYKVFAADFSEVDGLDNIKSPENCIFKSQKKASEIYGTKNTFFLTNGASSGIVASVMSILKDKDKVLVARNAHESVFNGLVLSGATPVWFLPEYDEKFGISKGITLAQVQSLYKNNADAKALIITSPTYEGVVSEIKKIAEFCKEKGIIFIVDEAHGALFPFSDKLPESAINLGADIVVHSLHKTTPALTGTALLHICRNSKIEPDTIQENLNLITTTSPSWLLLASIDGTIEFLNTKRCKREIAELIENIKNLKNENKKFEFLTSENHDETKLLILKEGFSGEELSNYLDKNNFEDELVTDKSVLCLCGIGTTKRKLKKLSHLLNKFSQRKSENIANAAVPVLPEMKLSPREAYSNGFEVIKSENAIGRIIAENITPYPPCIPVLMAGEIISAKHLAYLPKNVKVIRN